MPGRLRFEETDAEGRPTGRSVILNDVNFAPLGYAQLLGAKPSKPIVVPLSGHAARGEIHGPNGSEQEGRGRFQSSLESEFTSDSIGLVRGGWLPSGLAIKSDMIVFPDRCVVAKLKQRLVNGVPKTGIGKDFLDLFADTPIRINPLLFALEADVARQPTEAEAKASLEEAIGKIAAALPLAELVAGDQAGLQGALGLIADGAEGMRRKTAFLKRVWPFAASPVARSSLPERWQQVLSTADEVGVPSRSFVVLSVLSAIATPNGKSPAKKVLKLGGPLSEAKVYNGLSDLRALDILTMLLGAFPDQPTMFCTSDYDLAKLWVGVGAKDFEHRNGRVHYEIEASVLFPDVPDQLWDAFKHQ